MRQMDVRFVIKLCLFVTSMFLTTGAIADGDLDSVNGKSDSYFGDVIVGLGVYQTEFTQNDLYRDFYGNESLYPTLSVDYLFFNWYATLGLGFRFGMFHDEGFAANSTASAENVVISTDSKTTFSMYPIQGLLLVNLPLLPHKWITATAWYGVEHALWREVREDDSTDIAGSFVNKGEKKANVAGGAINIQLNWLDPSSRGGATDALGIKAVNLSPTVEYINSATEDGINLSRVSYGLNFTFEM